jgi:UDP-glucuronate 4-epimerase
MLTYNKMHFFSTPFFLELVQITHVMHLVAQAAVRYAMENTGSYVQSNIAELVNMYLRDICKPANPQPSIAWAPSSSV